MRTEEVLQHIPELYSTTIALRPLQSGNLPLAHGYHVYALFLNIIRLSDSNLAERLHADEAVKPFTVSTLNGKIRSNGSHLLVSTDIALSLKLTFLDFVVFSHFMDGFLKWGERPVVIAGTSFHLEKVETTPGNGSLAACHSYQGILDGSGTSRRLDIEFLSPVVFRSKGKRNVIFPEPALVFGSYWNKWQALSPVKMDDNLNMHFVKMGVTRYQLETGIWDFGSYQEVGFRGNCRFEIDPSIPDASVSQINALADFARFCGTGAKTTMGMGQTRRLDHAGFISGGARSYH